MLDDKRKRVLSEVSGSATSRCGTVFSCAVTLRLCSLWLGKRINLAPRSLERLRARFWGRLSEPSRPEWERNLLASRALDKDKAAWHFELVNQFSSCCSLRQSSPHHWAVVGVTDRQVAMYCTPQKDVAAR